MKAIVMDGPKKSKIIEVPMVKMDDHQVLIKIKYVGVCMSEHYGWSVANEGDAFGHEPMGVVVEVGKDVEGFNVGDKVSGYWDDPVPGVRGMVEYAVADPKVDCVIKLPEHVREVDMIVEPLACIMSAVSKARLNMPGETVAIVGCGYMACGAIGLLKKRGAYVVAVDIQPAALELAKKYGADEAYLADEARERFVNGDYPGFDVVMEWAETNESLDLAINLTKQCGQLCIGGYHTGGKRLVDVQQLNVKAIECLSVHPRERDLLWNGAVGAVKLLGSGVWNYTNLKVKVYPMNKYDLAQEEMEKKYGKWEKSVIDMTMEDGEPYII